MLIFDKNTPRWVIFFIDLSICLFSLLLAYLLRFNFDIPQVEIDSFSIVFPSILLTRALGFYISKTYKGVVRYTSSKDAQRIFLVITAGSIFFIFLNLVAYYFINNRFVIPFSIIGIEYMASTFFMVSLRVMFKVLYFEVKSPSKEKRNVIIFGAGESGIITKRTLDRDEGTKYKVLAFVDDDEKKKGKKLEGITIYSAARLHELLGNHRVAHLVISVQHLSALRKQEIVDTCLSHNTKVLTVPPVKSWINGELSFKQIKKVQIEELLERQPIKLDEENIKRQLTGKRILVTGAAGSIGSELVRQMLKYRPEKIILLDQAESPLYDMELELAEQLKLISYEIVVGDIRNMERMKNVFHTFYPQVVFHAAAYKHVPLMENNPSEAILTNILGTKITADLAAAHQVEKFVMISTDKAVNPTNIMGASKRVAEIYVQALSKISSTKFITTRFGNVLGSNGSVIPIFKQQIEKGGPVTITHPEVTRYFMTISEACQLVLEAGAMGKGEEVFIFDMGKLVRIADLAKKMIRLSGLTLDKDIEIVYTGLRPGEKLYEELLNEAENALPTHHPQIMIARVRECAFDTISGDVKALIALFDEQNNMEIVKKMKDIVPEYKSNNSIYETLDMA